MRQPWASPPANKHFLLRRLTLVYLLSLILAMTSFQTPATSPNPDNSALTASDEPVDPPRDPKRGEQHKQLLYTLLLGELAGNRGDAETALKHYLEAARSSLDPQIAQQATQWAVQFQDPLAAVVAAELWAKAAPNDLQAQMVASTLLVGQSIERSVPYLTRAIEINPAEVNQHIIGIQARLSEKSAEHLKTAFDLIAKNRPLDAYAQVAAAQTSASLGDITTANAWVDSALQLNPNLTPALQLKARLIRHADDSDTRALNFLEANVNRFENNDELRLFYASALLDANRLEEAKNHLMRLTQNKTIGGQALIFLGEIYIREENYLASADMLKKALSFPDNRDNARYLLGELSEHQGQTSDAIRWYTMVNPGPYHIVAILRAAYLLKQKREFTQAIYVLHDGSPSTLEEQKQLILSEVDILASSRQAEDAYNLINTVLEKLPTDPDVLLAHSLVAIKLKHWNIAERNLKKLLAQNPNHADALNTLGYALSLQKDKRASAKPYILQALQISPNNPAYLDTLGWFYYQIGDYNQALTSLKKAEALNKGNSDITAHLIELLWVMGNQTEARSLLKQALEKTPEDDTLKETTLRLKIDLKTANGSSR